MFWSERSKKSLSSFIYFNKKIWLTRSNTLCNDNLIQFLNDIFSDYFIFIKSNTIHKFIKKYIYIFIRKKILVFSYN